MIVVVTAIVPPVAPGEDPAATTVVVALAITAALTEVSYRFIEMPVRHRGFGVALAPLWDSWTSLRRGRGAWTSGSTVLAGVAAVVIVAATVSVVTAPAKSQAQLAVERGERAMAEQEAAAAEGTGTAPTTTPDTATPDTATPATSTPDTTTTTVPPQAWPSDLAVPSGDRIVGFGDSVLSGAAPAMYEQFPGITLDAKPIRQWRDAPALVEQAASAGTLRRVVVLNFGTNAGLESEESRAALRQILDLLQPDHRVVLVNIVGVSSWVPASNATLASIAADYPNTIVADWHSVVAADPSLLHLSLIHI